MHLDGAQSKSTNPSFLPAFSEGIIERGMPDKIKVEMRRQKKVSKMTRTEKRLQRIQNTTVRKELAREGGCIQDLEDQGHPARGKTH